MVAASYSIGKAERMRSASVGAPGPASYKPVILAKAQAPEWRMGIAKRPNQVQNTSPSPADYELNSLPDGPQYSMTGKRLEKLQSRPGPASYSPKNNYEKKPSAVMLGRGHSPIDPSQDRAASPGPGSYNIGQSIVLDSRAQISKAKRDLSSSAISPGPGDYLLMDDASKFTPKFSFGHELRDTQPKEIRYHTIGPGQYNIPSFMRTDHGFCLGPKRQFDIYKTPGPSQYQPNDAAVFKRQPVCRIGSTHRDNIIEILNSTVGPAQYNPSYLSSRQNSSGIKIGSSKRYPIDKLDLLPGPGQYQFGLSTNDGPMFSMRTKDCLPIDKQRLTHPGPSSYRADMTQVFNRTQSISIGNQKRDQGSDNHIPGPGQYKHKKFEVRPQQKFCRQQRSQELKSHTPGPGQYDMKDFFADEQGQGINQRAPQQKQV